jgi:hypothetical protein
LLHATPWRQDGQNTVASFSVKSGSKPQLTKQSIAQSKTQSYIREHGGIPMADNVVQLPRPQQFRSPREQLAFFVHVGRNDHKELLELIAAGERGIFGVVIEAPYVDRHKELITEARKRDFDVVLDPRTQQMGLPGSYKDALASLPWGQSRRHQTAADFDGEAGEVRVAKIVEFALEHGFTQLLGPSHLIGDPNDPWLRRDIGMMTWTSRRIEREGGNLGLIYSVALPMAVLRDDSRREAIITSINDAPCDAIWPKVENFGDDASGEKTAAYIKACRDFHSRGLPLVADHVGGLPAIGTLAFGAVGGIAHGVTVNQNFRAASWRRPAKKGGGGISRRIYLPQLDLLVEREIARQFLTSSQRIRSRHVCRDPHCCSGGLTDMLGRPARHALYQRAREIEKISEFPTAVRIATYLEGVRRVSDDVALVAGFDKIDPEFRQKLQLKQKELGHFRDAMAHLATTSKEESVAVAPLRRPSAGRPGR